MKFYNTMSKKIEEFIPHVEGSVKLYTCGPTVYNYAHIGNLRSYIMEDVLEKTLRYIGYDVTRCMNITDVGHLASDADTGEDKMVKSAKEQNKKVLDIAAFYTEAFFEDFKKLNIKYPDIVSPATENIEEYIRIIKKLIKTGYAYESEGNIYFDTSKLDNYYKLTNQSADEMMVGVREDVTEDVSKKNKTDFVLWFTKSKFDDQDLKWESPFGLGYPGWHIECSGICLKHFGEYLDIHCGGVDNAFPHHTNEIAQSEAFLGHDWCNFWFHVEFLNDVSGKMSKSKGEFLRLQVLIDKGYNPLSYRFMCLGSHFRNQLIFTYESLDNNELAYKKLKKKVLSLDITGDVKSDIFDEFDNKFKEVISDNLNTANAITLIYDLLKSDINDKTKYELIKSWDNVLGLDLTKQTNNISDKHEYIMEKIEERNEAKKNKNYSKADEIRNNLLEEGIILEDTREGTIYKIES